MVDPASPAVSRPHLIQQILRGVSGVLYALTDTKHSAWIFACALFAAFCLIPWWLGSRYQAPHMLDLAALAAVATPCVLLGFYLPIVDFQFGARRKALTIDATVLHVAIWVAFGLFVVVAFITAPAIPLLSALQGHADVVDLDEQRAAFLKTREGWQATFPYISGIFAGALLPYSMASLLLNRARGRYGALAAFLLYAVSYLQKALFLQVLLPVFYLVAQRKVWNIIGLGGLLLFAFLILFANTRLVQDSDFPAFAPIAIDFAPPLEAGTMEDGARRAPTASGGTPVAEFFRAGYSPRSSFEFVLWRALSVPVFTARDSLIVFDTQFDHKYLFGATSSFVATLFGLDRVNYDAAVHGYQYGESRIGRANAIYLVEGFVNFGWIGVILFSLMVGQCFRIFWKSPDDAVKAMWPLFAYNVIQAQLIGSMLSSGFALIFLIALFVDVRWRGFSPASRRDQG